MVQGPELQHDVAQLLRKGTVIPAHPLALTEERRLDIPRQRTLTRYYLASGAGGIAVGVHTTQFEIHEANVNLYGPVLEATAETIEEANLKRPFIKVAGIIGPTSQAIQEASVASKLGYHLGLVSMGGLTDYTEADLIKRTEEIAAIIPVFGFYLQSAVGGRPLSFDFWSKVSEIPGVLAIKIAPFQRYQTLDVVRAVCSSSRCNEIALYTGNDDNIVVDLLTKYRFEIFGKVVEKSIVGGLLGHWAVWTQKAVELFTEIQNIRNLDVISKELLTRAMEITDVNSAFFDTKNNFKGCISGIHEVLRRQGLLTGTWCLNPDEILSEGQSQEIDRVYASYPHLNDDNFVHKHLSEWLK